MNKRKEVSKGLRSLLANIEKTHSVAEKTQLVKDLASQIMLLQTDSIEVNPFQPRTEFDNEQLLELAKSIKVNGLIQPITVRSMGDGKYQLISGERRLRASKMAGIKEIPAYIRVANDQEMLEMALVENIQRANLNAIEIAISYQRLMDECDLTHDALSDRVGKERSTVSNYVRLLKLSPDIQNAVKSSQISMGHAKALAGIENSGIQNILLKKCLEQGLSVRALEHLTREAIHQKNKPEAGGTTHTPQHPEVTKMMLALSQKLGIKVDIKRTESGKGQILVKFSDDQELNKLMQILLES
ncbi:MAG: ParB/RepB/Spo0J family partition protein [Saprospiraceae bacterium]